MNKYTNTNLQYVNYMSQPDSEFKRAIQRQKAKRTIVRALRGSQAICVAVGRHIDREANPHKYALTN